MVSGALEVLPRRIVQSIIVGGGGPASSFSAPFEKAKEWMALFLRQ